MKIALYNISHLLQASRDYPIGYLKIKKGIVYWIIN